MTFNHMFHLNDSLVCENSDTYGRILFAYNSLTEFKIYTYVILARHLASKTDEIIYCYACVIRKHACIDVPHLLVNLSDKKQSP